MRHKSVVYFMFLVSLFFVFGCVQRGQAQEHSEADGKMARIQSLLGGRASADDSIANSQNGLWNTSAKVDFDQSGPKVLQALGLCVGLFLVLAHFLRRHGAKQGRSNKRRARVLERCPLASKTALMIVEVDGQEYLLTVGAEQVTLIKGSDKTQFVQAITLDQAIQELCEKETDLAA